MNTTKESLPLGKQWGYAIGQLGWSTLINIIGLQLVYFYIPPEGSGIETFIPQVTFLMVINIITMIAAGGRLWDAITDPLIANLSDRWKGKRGRRIPFLAAGAVPAALFCTLMFVPIVMGQSGWNVAWLFAMQTFFYLFLTVYVTPFFALIPELGHTADERLNLSTWISITYALGIMV
ncbi:MAG TPA: MFS transporter, partial [Spirochaetota bacterium]|nr:MFS transporter [Spirochaetota bacterium]